MADPPCVKMRQEKSIIEREGELTPAEVNWMERPRMADARHVLAVLAENKRTARRGVVVCRYSRPLRLHEQVTAIPGFRR